MPRSGSADSAPGRLPAPGPTSVRVLVVEDEAMLSLMLQDMLEELGCTVAGTAARVEDALELARDLVFDVALLDVNLGGSRIDPVAQAVAARGLPIVFATGYDLDGGPCDAPGLLLKKPYDIESLRRALRQVLDEKRSQAELEPAPHAPPPEAAAAVAGEPVPRPAAAASEERLALALEAGRMGTWEWVIATGEVQWSAGLEAIHGLEPGGFGGTLADFERDIHPDDRSRVREAISRAVEQGEEHHVEYRIVRPDGETRWVEGRGRLLRDDAGAAERMLGVCSDVTERKQAEERQRLLVDELNHRAKNMLAIVQAMATQTLREAPEPAAFKDRFLGRLSALNAAHSLLTQELWRGASLADVVASALAPVDPAQRESIACRGPAVEVPPNAAVTLCLMLHELATHAAARGALATEEGSVDVSWRSSAVPADGRRSIEVIWVESGVRAPEPPEGFGARMIASGAAQLGGQASTECAVDGLVLTLRFPLPEQRARAFG